MSLPSPCHKFREQLDDLAPRQTVPVQRPSSAPSADALADVSPAVWMDQGVWQPFAADSAE